MKTEARPTLSLDDANVDIRITADFFGKEALAQLAGLYGPVLLTLNGKVLGEAHIANAPRLAYRDFGPQLRPEARVEFVLVNIKEDEVLRSQDVKKDVNSAD